MTGAIILTALAIAAALITTIVIFIAEAGSSFLDWLETMPERKERPR